MITKLLTASALTLMLAGGAYAQDTSSTGDDQSGETSPNTVDALSPEQQELYDRWTENEMNTIFFTDDTMTTFRTEAEITAAFGGMSVEQQDMVREDCRLVSGATESYDPTLVEFCQRINAI